MLRRSFRNGMLFGLLAGAAAAAFKAVQGRAGSGAPEPAPTWSPLPRAEPVTVPPRPAPAPAPAPAPRPAPLTRTERPSVDLAVLQEDPAAPPPAAPRKSKKPAPPRQKKPAPWVDPVDGEAPSTHPIKAKLSSGIYHVPGGFNYARTKPDRCYVDEAAAEADGLRPSKR